MSAHRHEALKHVGLLAVLFLCLQCAFAVCNICAELVPKEPVVQHLQESADSPLMARKFDYRFHVLGSEVSYDNNRFLLSMAQQDTYDGDVVKASIMCGIDYDIGDGTVHQEYYRYWHGWQLLAFLCLLIGPVELFAGVVALIVIASSAFFILELRRFIGWLPALVFAGVAFFATNLFGNFMGDLLMALSVFALVACCGFILRSARKRTGLSARYAIDSLCMVSGALFCFLDFFTVPSFAIALAVFTALIASNVMDKGFGAGVALFIRFSVLFMVGFAGTWMVKWLLAACYIGLPAALGGVFQEVGFWSQDKESTPGVNCAVWLYEASPRLYAPIASFYYVLRDMRLAEFIRWNPAGLLALLITVCCLLAAFVSWLRARKAGGGATGLPSSRRRSGVWAAFLPALYVPAYALLAYSHTIWHIGIFGYKPWSFVLATIAGMSLYLLLHQLPQRGK